MNLYSPLISAATSQVLFTHQVLNILSLITLILPNSFLPMPIFAPLLPQSLNQDPKWKDAMNAEIAALVSNNTWTLTPLPSNKRVIGCKWVYRVKYKVDGLLERYIARLVAKGFT